MMIEEVEIGLFAVDIGEPLNDFEREQEKRDRTDVGMRLMSDLREAWGVNNHSDRGPKVAAIHAQFMSRNGEALEQAVAGLPEGKQLGFLIPAWRFD